MFKTETAIIANSFKNSIAYRFSMMLSILTGPLLFVTNYVVWHAAFVNNKYSDQTNPPNRATGRHAARPATAMQVQAAKILYVTARNEAVSCRPEGLNRVAWAPGDNLRDVFCYTQGGHKLRFFLKRESAICDRGYYI